MGKKKSANEDFLLFKEVRCGGYYARARDYSSKITLDYDRRMYTVTHGDKVCEDVKQAQINRKYYKLNDTPFTGIYVGTKSVVVEAEITEWIDDDGCARYDKKPVIVEPCAIIYYAPNRKHLVPLKYLNIK